MKKIFLLLMAIGLTLPMAAKSRKTSTDLFPDGTPVPEWFRQTDEVELSSLGKQYRITDYGVLNDGQVHTAEMQALIDRIAADGGGVVVVPQGTFLTGALFFRPGTHLYLMEDAVLKGSDDISDYPILKTRIEGETCNYFSALINADSLDGFTISGRGTIDGNGLRYWRAFWLRRKWNPACTNKDEMRPRLVYVSNSKNVTICGVHLQNSPFWTTHIYNSEYVKLLNLSITSPAAPVKAPSTDAIDIDVCRNLLVKGCYMSVNDDAIALKGGKGPWADDPAKAQGNGGNENIIIEDCVYGFCHGCLTCGSESVYDHNIVLRRIQVDQANNLLWLKMRPDTPQRYEYITVEDITGNAKNFLLVKPWTQFYDLKDRADMPMSYSDHITMRNIDFECDVFFNVRPQEDQYHLSNFTFENLNIQAKNGNCDRSVIDGFTYNNVNVNQ
jgi:polygalacturonase